MKPGVTVLVLVPNARDRLPKALESVKWAEDILCVVDSKTTDGSDDIARQYTERVVVHEYENAAAQRNWALPQIETEWTLVLDADEWLSDALTARVREIVGTPDGSNGYEIRRRSYFFGRLMNYCGWHRDYNLRLFRTEKGRYLEKRVHSRVVVEGDVGVIHEPMFHDTYRDFDEYFATFQRFTTWGAQDLFETGRSCRYVDLSLRPVQRFLKMYVARQGFRDGYHGLILCMLSAFSVFTKYAKLWDLQRKQRDEK